MDYDTPTFKATVIYKSDYTFKLKFPIDVLIIDIKIEIEKLLETTLVFNYLYFYDENILEVYDRWEFSKFVKEKTFIKYEKDAEYLFIIYPKEDHEEMLKDLDFIK